MTNREQGIRLERKVVSRIALTVLLTGMLTLGFGIDGGYALAGDPHIWHIETVDSDDHVGRYSSIALDSNDNPHITYYDDTNQDLKYAYYDGTWHIETVDAAGDVGEYSSIALDSGDNPHISYRDQTDLALNYAYYNGTWHIETVDNTGNVGQFTSIALDSNDNPHISYNGFGLQYAYYDGTWHIQIVDSGNIYHATSIALDGGGNIHISYNVVTPDHLKYAYYDGAWHTETVDSSNHVGEHNSIALDSNDKPHISYRDAVNGHLKRAYYDGGWNIEIVDSYGNAGAYSSIALDSNDNPHISYEASGLWALKYAYHDGTWHTETVDSYDMGEWGTSIVLDSSDNPHISYYDASNNDLKYACPAYELIITTTEGGTTDPTPGTYTYVCGSSVEVTAIPNTCYLFDHWELDGEDVGSADPYSVLMDDGHTLHAVFIEINYDLTITTTAGGTTDPAPGIYSYPCDSSGQVMAIPDSCYLLDHWELDGDDVGSANPYSVLMDDDHTLHAVFAEINYDLTITTTAGGTTDPVPGIHSYPCDSSVEATAIPHSWYLFDHWELDGDDVGPANPYSVLMDDDHTLHAVFETTYCQVSPTSLDFGTVALGSYLDKTFAITNTGGEILTGSVSESCDHYAIISGGGAYSLGPGDSVVVTVRFEPTSVGQHDCTVETDNDLCGDVYCNGVGRGEWYWKLAYEDYAPSGVPDIDQRQDDWIKLETSQFAFCGPCAVANCFKWFDSKYNVPPGFPGDGVDMFPLVRDYMDQLAPFSGWDDHDPWNVDHVGTQWNPGVGWPPPTDQPFVAGPQPQPSSMPPWGELVERLAWYFDTDGIQTGYCNHAGTDVLDMQQGIQDWLDSEMFDDGNYLADTLCVAITARPTFAYVESLVEESENVILLLGFWYPGEAPVQQQFQEFIRGDFSGDGSVDAGDEFMCISGGPFSCDDAADVNDDGILSMTDCAYLHAYLFSGGPPPPPPFPDCGLDPTPDELDCASFAACGQWRRVGGHYVTVAGVNSIEQKIAVSDPFIDATELGLAEGRVGDGWLIEHFWGSHDPTVHNDEGNVSHDVYLVEESDDPGGRWHLVNYAVSSDPYYWTENFSAQNVPEEFLAATQPWDGVSPIFTEVEYCIHVSPWDYRGDCNGDGEVQAGDIVCLIGYLFRGLPPPDPYLQGDANCDGEVGPGDIVYLINYLFRGWDVPRCCYP